MNLDSLIDAVINEGGFDTRTGAVSRETVKGWINDRLRTLAAESGYLRSAVELGPSVADQAQYVVPDNVTDIRRLHVSGVPYFRDSIDRIFEARAFGGVMSNGYGGVFAPGFSTGGQHVVELWPTPSSTGLTISALCTVTATALDAGTDTPAVPEEFHPALKAGAIATGLRLIYERHDDADRWEREFSDAGSGRGAVQLLKRRSNSRVGSGPMFARVVG
jgi:hypothetical protein